jgi:hypothetical protein
VDGAGVAGWRGRRAGGGGRGGEPCQTDGEGGQPSLRVKHGLRGWGSGRAEEECWDRRWPHPGWLLDLTLDGRRPESTAPEWERERSQRNHARSRPAGNIFK